MDSERTSGEFELRWRHAGTLGHESASDESASDESASDEDDDSLLEVSHRHRDDEQHDVDEHAAVHTHFALSKYSVLTPPAHDLNKYRFMIATLPGIAPERFIEFGRRFVAQELTDEDKNQILLAILNATGTVQVKTRWSGRRWATVQ